MNVQTLAELLQDEKQQTFLLDVRTPREREVALLEPSLFIPLQELHLRFRELAPYKEKRMVVYCHHGIRSDYATHFLKDAGFDDVHNLEGGIDAWSLEIDPNVQRY